MKLVAKNLYSYRKIELADKSKPTCFIIVSRIPYPPIGGDKLKYFNTIEILKVRFKISIAIITDEKLTPEMKEYLDNSVDEYKVFYYPASRFKFNALKAFFSSKPLQVGYYYFEEVHQYCLEKIKPDFFVMANLIRTALYVQDLPNLKFIDIVDSIYLNYTRSVNRVTSIFWRIVYRIEIKRLHLFEKECVSRFDVSLFCNWDERNYYKDFGKAIWIPNGVHNELLNKLYFKKDKTLHPEVVFFGKMDYQPNIDAVNWFVNKVLPLVDNLKIRIIGGSPNSRIKAQAKKNPISVIIEGYIQNPYQAMFDATAVVAPMQTGGGIQNKILEAMAIGAVVITTSLGAKAIIGAVDGEHLIICDKAEDYATVINNLYKNPERMVKVGINAKKLIKENFTWDLYSQKLYDTLDEVTRNKEESNKIA